MRLLIGLSLLITFQLFANIQPRCSNLIQAQSSEGTPSILQLETDSAGDIYTLGYVGQKDLSLDGKRTNHLMLIPYEGFYLAKYSTNTPSLSRACKLEWQVTFHNTNNPRTTYPSITPDGQGGVFLAFLDHPYSSLHLLDSSSLNRTINTQSSTAYTLISIDSQGRYRWAQPLSSTGPDFWKRSQNRPRLSFDQASSTLFIAGTYTQNLFLNFNNTSSYTPTLMTSTPSSQAIFIAAFLVEDLTSAVKLQLRLASTLFEFPLALFDQALSFPTSVSLANDGSLYVGGSFGSALTPVCHAGSTQYPSGFFQDGFVTKVKPNGSCSWTAYLISSATNNGVRALDDASNGVFVTGNMNGFLSLKGSQNTQQLLSAPNGYSSQYLAFFNHQGVPGDFSKIFHSHAQANSEFNHADDLVVLKNCHPDQTGDSVFLLQSFQGTLSETDNSFREPAASNLNPSAKAINLVRYWYDHSDLTYAWTHTFQEIGNLGGYYAGVGPSRDYESRYIGLHQGLNRHQFIVNFAATLDGPTAPLNEASFNPGITSFPLPSVPAATGSLTTIGFVTSHHFQCSSPSTAQPNMPSTETSFLAPNPILQNQQSRLHLGASYRGLNAEVSIRNLSWQQVVPAYSYLILDDQIILPKINVPAGTYWVNVQTDRGILTKKLIVQ